MYVKHKSGKDMKKDIAIEEKTVYNHHSYIIV